MKSVCFILINPAIHTPYTPPHDIVRGAQTHARRTLDAYLVK